MQDKRALSKLRREVEKAKRVLSTQLQTPVPHSSARCATKAEVAFLAAKSKLPMLQAAEAHFDASQALEMNAKLEETGKYDFQLKAVLSDSNGSVVAETWGSYALRNFLGR